VKTVLLTLGDAAGIGPEVLVKCLASVPAVPGLRPLVIGELDILRATAESLGITLRFSGEDADGAIAVRSLGLLAPGSFEPGKLSAACGDAAYRYFAHAVEECLAGRAHAIVTAPLNKEAMNLGGHAFVGHTDILEQMTGVEGPVMALWHPKIVVGHVTDHLPLRQALDAITGARVKQVVRLTRDALARTGTAAPRIALAGINPHAGENGLFGREEIEILGPAMAELRAEGVDVSGPHPGDTVFLQALRGRYDAVIAMYHDQGFGPMKTLDFANGVNCTLGLPFVRTSPDHGTAFEIAGKGIAEPESMIAAWRLAVKLLG
jgi:4-hydroxythreonine-4-phosphate dehydrogenase